MLSRKNVYSIFKKELRNYFNNPAAYIVLVVFLLLWQFLFFRNAFVAADSSLRGMIGMLPWLFLFLIPAITMASIAEEKSAGTLEFLLSHPLNDLELVVGKFLAALFFVFIGLLFLLPVAISLSFYGNFDWGAFAGQFLGSFLFASLLISLGIFVSSLLGNQISSLIVSAALSFLLVIFGSEMITGGLPSFLGNALENLSGLSHFSSIVRGLITFRDLWYFASGSAIFLGLSYLLLLKRRMGKNWSFYRKVQLGLGISIVFTIVINLFVAARVPGRIDLTADRLYTLSPATDQILKNLSEPVVFTLYISDKLPPQSQGLVREVKGVLQDYKSRGKGKVKLEIKNPSKSEEIAKEALEAGVQEMRFNVMGQEELQIKSGFLGVKISQGETKEAIPFISDLSDFEYQLTSLAKKVTAKDKKKIVFLTGHQEKSVKTDYTLLEKELAKQFTVEEFMSQEITKSLPDNTAALVIAGPTAEIKEEERKMIADYLDNGGSAFFLIDTHTVSPQGLTAAENKNSFADFLEDYGVIINKDIVFDTRSNETVRFTSSDGMGFFFPYPFWPRVKALDPTSRLASKIESIVLPWASSINVNEEKLLSLGLAAEKVFATTKLGGAKPIDASLAPDQKIDPAGLEEKTAVLALSGAKLPLPGAGRQEGAGGKKPRIVVVGNSDFMADGMAGNFQENLFFAINSVSWLGQEESLAKIKSKQMIDHRLSFQNNTQMKVVKYFNLVLAVILPLGYGSLRIWRRRGLRKFSYGTRL